MLRIIGMTCLGLTLGLWLVGCQESTPLQSCQTNEDCASNTSCSQGRCQPFLACASDLACRWPESQCSDKLCLPSTACQSSSSCPHPGHQCIQGFCSFEPKKEQAASLYFKFRPDSNSTVKDDSPLAKHGIWKGGGLVVSEGYMGSAGSFNGKDAYLEISSHDAIAQPIVTVEAWIKPDIIQQSIIVRFCDDACKNGYAMTVSAAGQLNFQVANASVAQSCFGKSSIPKGVWTHISGSYDGKAIRCFVNGVLETSTAWSGKVTYGKQVMWVGGQSNLTQLFSGLIDEVAVLPWGREKTFAPGLQRYLYVAGSDGFVYVMDTARDALAPERRFTAPNESVPILLSNQGQTLYLWSPSKKSILAWDVETKTILATVHVPEGGISEGALASVDSTSHTLWLWGQTTVVFALPLTTNAKPKATFSGLGTSVGLGIAWEPITRKFLVSDPEEHQIHQLSAQTLKPLPSLVLNHPELTNQQPGAIASNPVTRVLYVASKTTPELQLFAPKQNTYSYQGVFSIQETAPNGSIGKPRKISSLLAHSLGEYLFYTFVDPGYVYRLDIQDKTQHLIRGKSRGRPIDLLTSSYMMHLHHQGHKLYVQHDNTGTIHVMDILNRQVLQTIQLGQSTKPGRYAIVGLTHSSQAF